MLEEVLYKAVSRGDLAKVQRMLDYIPGIDVDAVNEDNIAPLQLAIEKKHTAIVEVLLDHGADVDGPVGARRTPLQQACLSHDGNEEIVALLIYYGAGVDETTYHDRRTPLTLACRSNDNVYMIEQLIDDGADVNGDDGGSVAPMHEAARYGNVEAIELLLENCADKNIVTTEDDRTLPAGSTPLHFASTYGQSDCVDILLEAGADANIVNEVGETPVHHAALQSYADIVSALLENGCDPLHNNDGRTPLQLVHEVNPN
jgi:ankyrin repeat protein